MHAHLRSGLVHLGDAAQPTGLGAAARAAIGHALTEAEDEVPPASRESELHLFSLAGDLLAETRARNLSALMVFVLEDDGFARHSRLRPGNEYNPLHGPPLGP